MTAERLRSTPLGTRVVVRSYIEGGQRATDTLGHLVALTEEWVTVETKTGPVDLLLADVILSKPVPPAPERRAPRRKPN
ncbi:hypothetical protein [Ornithinimicrobium sp. INDO-MA30-4]|uniref:putative acetyltransferase n=1 Tax=Ornithinimicrobium sp. INDO-MA30-4 TaxID=2908651 RepID=UPI001F3536E7|nr:hypothetical protein [Ornithinimicrobium sp. INDO-MA30-4]UJH69862.1 hypothetical protein L0A91_11505 [Ornithinimicrobium sp. INDO-MA30-4]